MHRKILVPLDGSTLAERVVPVALYLAETMKGSITFLTVVVKKPGMDLDLTVRAIQTGSYEADLYLRSLKKRYLLSLAPIETAVITGKPDREIIKYAKTNAFGLIVMFTHGRSGITRWSLGRTVDKVLRRAPCPMVILRSQQDAHLEQFKRILLPLDGSLLAERILLPTLKIIRGQEIELFMIQVVEKGSFYGFGHNEDHIVGEVEKAKAYLAEVSEREMPPGVVVHTHVEVGSAADVIVDFAKAEDIDLILVSSRGNTGFDSWMFGSVAEKVMKGAPCAIMVIRQEPI
ncbi:MAG: hypothetical protein CSB13_03940 [Chloroflexi bacterium]|nr:MAG: hypothetical protein CSB13_03940 [Chloroflexota bacterium]